MFLLYLLRSKIAKACSNPFYAYSDLILLLKYCLQNILMI